MVIARVWKYSARKFRACSAFYCHYRALISPDRAHFVHTVVPRKVKQTSFGRHPRARVREFTRLHTVRLFRRFERRDRRAIRTYGRPFIPSISRRDNDALPAIDDAAIETIKLRCERREAGEGRGCILRRLFYDFIKAPLRARYCRVNKVCAYVAPLR